jgi:two-component system OmpR family sensor kinase
MAATTIATHVLLVKGMNTRVSAELAHETGEFRALAARRGAAATRPGQVLALLRARTRQAVLERDTALIGLMAGRIVATSTNYSPRALGANPALLARWAGVTRPTSGTARLAAGPARYEAIPVGATGHRRGGVFIAAVLTASDRAHITDVAQIQLEVGAIALLLGSALAWVAAGRVLRPVRDTTDLARRITETDLSERIPVRGQNEISELAVTFNRMLDRLETALTAQRRFLADAGHELRTPITIIQGNLDTLPATSPEDLQTLTIASDELARMTRMVEELTMLAASERPDFLRRSAADLPGLTRTLVAKARALGDRPCLLTGTADGAAILDPQRVTQAVMQLAANAVAHTPAGTPVEIGSAIEGGSLTFRVADRGPGIPPDSQARIFERFARLDPRRTSGTGLGLSVVAAICAAHGGSAGVTARPGGGAVFTVSVPYVPAGPATDRRRPSLKEALT